MAEHITYWACRECHGTGKVIIGGGVYQCDECDGTGNALIDGRARAHARAVAEIEAAHPAPGERTK